MDITPILPKGSKVIKGYGEMAFKVNDEKYEGSIILLPESVHSWNISKHSDITPLSLQIICDNSDKIEILLIGCGETHIPMPVEIISHFMPLNIGIEIMTTGAACRTYNVLLAEGRKVAAALIAV